MGKGKGYGKVILFNEHFVVYGIPSIVSAIDMETTATVARTPDTRFTIDDRRDATPGYKDEKFGQQLKATGNIFDAIGIRGDKNMEITLDGNLKAASGVGASAASCVAIARALSDEYGLNLSDDRINELAFEGEKGYHGTPSGVDNTAATFGGLIWFQRGDKIVMDRIRMKAPVEIVMGDSGLVTDTKKAVDGVRKRKEAQPEKYDAYFKSAASLAGRARTALEQGKLDTVGKLMDENHALLQNIGVSCEKLDSMVEIARGKGAIGTKLTGSGLGGYMVALTPGPDVQKKVGDALENAGYRVLRTRIGV